MRFLFLVGIFFIEQLRRVHQAREASSTFSRLLCLETVQARVRIKLLNDLEGGGGRVGIAGASSKAVHRGRSDSVSEHFQKVSAELLQSAGFAGFARLERHRLEEKKEAAFGGVIHERGLGGDGNSRNAAQLRV